MNKAELVAAVAEKTGLSKKDSEKAVNAAFDAISAELVEGGKVQLVGFGSFETKTFPPSRPAKPSRTPSQSNLSPKCERPPVRLERRSCFIRGTDMRLDKYLKVSRLIKRRSVANDACDADRILVNGRQAKASYQVKVGDVLEIAFGQRTLKVEVTQVADNVSKSDAPAMYKEIV